MARTRPSHLVIATIAPSVSTWILYAGMDRGLFTDAGVRVELQTMHNSAAHMKALLEGTVPIGDQLSDHVIRAAINGSDLVAFLGVDRPDTHLMVRGEIDTLDQLRGGELAVDGLDTGYALVLRRILARHELIPGRDVALVTLGGTHQRFRSLLDGQIAGTLLDAPYRFVAAASGMRSLATASGVAPGYQGTVQACSRGWAHGHAALLTDYVRGYGMAWDWLHDSANRASAIDLLVARLGVAEAVAADTYASQVDRRRFNRRGAMVPGDLDQVLGLMNEAGQTASPAVLDRCCERSFLEAAGAFD